VPSSSSVPGRETRAECCQQTGRLDGPHVCCCGRAQNSRQSRPRRQAVQRSKHDEDSARTTRQYPIDSSVTFLDVVGPLVLFAVDLQAGRLVLSPPWLGQVKPLVNTPRLVAGSGDWCQLYAPTPDDARILKAPDFRARAGAEHDVCRFACRRHDVRGLCSVPAVRVELRVCGTVDREDEHELARGGSRRIHDGEHTDRGGCVAVVKHGAGKSAHILSSQITGMLVEWDGGSPRPWQPVQYCLFASLFAGLFAGSAAKPRWQGPLVRCLTDGKHGESDVQGA
jgi:hypothetical protein